MSNFIFFSPEPKLIVENLKMTVRFKKDDMSESEWVLRIIIRAPDQEDNGKKDLVLHLLLKQTEEEEIKITEIVDSESHKLLEDPVYLEYMGRSFKIIEEPPYRLETHENYEFEFLRQKKLIFPEKIEVRQLNPLDFDIDGKSLRKITSINKKDIGIRICCPETKTIRDKLYVLQFRLIIKDFIPSDVLRSMEDPGSGWALGINLNNKAENEEIFSRMITRIPDIKSLELWVGIPHRHLILDSSPRYQALYWFSPWDKERTEDLQDKYASLKRSKEFMNVVGDMWVKIVMDSHDRLKGIGSEFTIVGFSPWIGSKFQKVASELEDKVRDLVRREEMEKRLKEQEEDVEKKYISYKDAIVTWGLFASLLTVTLTAIALLVREIAGVSVPMEQNNLLGIGINAEAPRLTLGVLVEFALLFSIITLAFVYFGRFILKRLGMIKR